MSHKRGSSRVTADDYEMFIVGLCGGVPPGGHRDDCIQCITRRFLALYARYGVTAPPGLVAFAERTGADT
jgi:hypothetical protein